jgi:hypothetical protein
MRLVLAEKIINYLIFTRLKGTSVLNHIFITNGKFGTLSLLFQMLHSHLIKFLYFKTMEEQCQST